MNQSRRLLAISFLLSNFLMGQEAELSVKKSALIEGERKVYAEEGVSVNTWIISNLLESAKEVSASGNRSQEFADIYPAQKTKEITWSYFDDRLFSRNYDNYQDLFSYFKMKQKANIQNKTAYCQTYVFSPQEVSLGLYLTSDQSSLKTTFNDERVMFIKRSNYYRTGLLGKVKIKKGWNRLCVAVSNGAEEGRFGFYARFVGAGASQLTFSVRASGSLSIQTQAMKEISSPVLPTAFREWPYLQANAWDHLQVGSDAYLASLEFMNPDFIPFAESFRFTAGGGTPPYRWSLKDGILPTGLTLRENGELAGTPDEGAELKKYSFKISVKDTRGNQISSDYVLELRERPNRDFEQGRLAGLIHSSDAMPTGKHDEFAQNMKRMGYQYAIPITWANGGPVYFYYPSVFKPDAVDYIMPYKKSIEGQGMKFGMYMGNFMYGEMHGGDNGIIPFIHDALEKYHPKLLWFDWAGWESVSMDAVYSMIKSYDPEIVIVKNGVPTLSNGDWDSLSFEAIGCGGHKIWEMPPLHFEWIKKFPVETWRHMNDPEWDFTKGETENDPVDYWRFVISLAAEGNVCNFDHSVCIAQGKKYDGVKYTMDKLSDGLQWKVRQEMANWASPAGKPSLVESYTQVDPWTDQAHAWGYVFVSKDRQKVYCHLLKNPWGKSGFPASKKVTLSLPEDSLQKVTWLNSGKAIDFKGKKDYEISLKDVSEDPVSTILKLELKKPLTGPISKFEIVNKKQFLFPRDLSNVRNLAAGKPTKLIRGDNHEIAVPSAMRFSAFGNDGSLLTGTAAGGSYAWIYEVDLLKGQTVQQLVLHFHEKGFPTDYKISLSKDGNEWKEVDHVTRDKGGRYVHLFSPEETRYVRVEALKPDGPDQVGAQMSIQEIEVYSEK